MYWTITFSRAMCARPPPYDFITKLSWAKYGIKKYSQVMTSSGVTMKI